MFAHAFAAICRSALFAHRSSEHRMKSGRSSQHALKLALLMVVACSQFPLSAYSQFSIVTPLVWADGYAVPGIYPSGQAVCDERYKIVHNPPLPSIDLGGISE